MGYKRWNDTCECDECKEVMETAYRVDNFILCRNCFLEHVRDNYTADELADELGYEHGPAEDML